VRDELNGLHAAIQSRTRKCDKNESDQHHPPSTLEFKKK
jgi:hypothetical protein